LNFEHAPIRLEKGGAYRICGWHVGHAPQIERVEAPIYQRVEEEGE
jgi:hypothetical protein